jgi:RimJ/RimL family protein N-acetyltransferase
MEATKLMMDYAFNNLGVHRLYSLVIQGNDLVVNSAETLGFKTEAVLKGCFFVDGKYKNGVLIAAFNPTR